MPKKDTLKTYRTKRDFTQSSEPSGKRRTRNKKLIFVIQKHDASHLHFDFRIEVDGVLKSWAVPKGPSLNPAIKRLAAHTEDHPYDYAQFEGTIPEGNYGAGTVMIWDYGTYSNIKEKNGVLIPMQECLKKGTVEIKLHGKRLNGNFALVRMHDSDNWLLIKMNDEYASKRANPTKTIITSAKSGLTMQEIAHEEINKNSSSRAQKKRTTKKKEPKKQDGITITNEDKSLFIKPTITKGELITYYQNIAPHMLPYVKNRPASMQRFPDGINKEGFFQKDAQDYFPNFIETKNIAKADGSTDYVIINNAETLTYLANLATITIHTWLSTAKKLRYPDRIIFDLDPSGKDFNKVRLAALQLKEILDELGLASYPMITGSRGIHVWVLIKPENNYTVVKKFAHAIARKLVENNENTTLEIRKEKRKGKIFVDYLRNEFGSTAVAPYSVRPRPRAPVATPITWQEVKKTTLKPDQYTIKTIAKRLKTKGDVWQKEGLKPQSIKKALKLLKLIPKAFSEWTSSHDEEAFEHLQNI